MPLQLIVRTIFIYSQLRPYKQINNSVAIQNATLHQKKGMEKKFFKARLPLDKSLYLHTMLTDKSSDIFQGKNYKNILLEIDFKTLAPKLEKTFRQRIKKLQDNSSRKVRRVKLLQSLEFLQPPKNEAKVQPTPKKSESRNKTSSYLIYKKQQQALRANHNAKLLYLKSKFLESKPSSKRSNQASNQTNSLSNESQIKLSNSKINSIFIGMNETQYNYCKPKIKLREFYIKTTEGKRRKLNQLEYQNQLKTKLNIQPKGGSSKQLFQQFNECSQPTYVINCDQTSQNSEGQSINKMKRRFNIKNKVSSLCNFNRERFDQFRPWTSEKSEFGQ